jgi:hypothetical protein
MTVGLPTNAMTMRSPRAWRSGSRTGVPSTCRSYGSQTATTSGHDFTTVHAAMSSQCDLVGPEEPYVADNVLKVKIEFFIRVKHIK